MNTTSDSHDVIRELVQGSKSTFRRHFPFVFTYMTMHHIIVMASYDRKVWSLHRALASASTHQILVFSRCSPFLVPKHQFSACFNYFHLSIHSFSSDDERACCQESSRSHHVCAAHHARHHPALQGVPRTLFWQLNRAQRFACGRTFQ